MILCNAQKIFSPFLALIKCALGNDKMSSIVDRFETLDVLVAALRRGRKLSASAPFSSLPVCLRPWTICGDVVSKGALIVSGTAWCTVNCAATAPAPGL
jgi:hypothetical protein